MKSWQPMSQATAGIVLRKSCCIMHLGNLIVCQQKRRENEMKENMVVHFGAGALGRGLVVPLLSESGKQVVLAETNETLLTQFNQNNGYTLHIRDEESEMYLSGFWMPVLP